MVVKINMAKAYDRDFWKILVVVFRRFGFSERMVDMVVILVRNNWYSMLMNG